MPKSYPLRNRVAALSDVRSARLPLLRANLSDPAKDLNGSASTSLASTLRFLAVSGYVQTGDAAEFRHGLIEAVELRCSLFARFDAGEPVSPSYVSMRAFALVLDALAANDRPLAVKVAAALGGRETVEREYDRDFDVAFGYSLKALVEADGTNAGRWLERLRGCCERPKHADFRGYATAFQAIHKLDSGAATDGLMAVLVGHKKQSVGAGLFKDREDEMLCVWGLGLANLIRTNGLSVHIADELLPSVLLASIPSAT